MFMTFVKVRYMYLFLFGRDPELSKLELVMYLRQKKINYKSTHCTDKYILLDFLDKKEISSTEMMINLGGITRITKIYYSSDVIDVSFSDKLEIDLPKKLNYSISTFNIDRDEFEEIQDVLKTRFKSEKAKAVYKKPKIHKKGEKNTIVNPNDFFSWKLDENGFELFVLKLKDSSIYYFGITEACFNPKVNIIKDNQRPAKKELYSTSFRLAKILVNLLGMPKNSKMLDPFCGAGTFLIEGLCAGYDVIGVDLNEEMVDSARKNVEWAVKKYSLKNNYKIINGDSTSIFVKADGAVFEPYMGPFLNKLPEENRASQLISQLNGLYLRLFGNLTRVIPRFGRVVCIFPEFRTFKGRWFKVDEKVYLENGFRLVDVKRIDNGLNLINPISYDTPDGSKLKRQIIVLEKC